MINKYNPSNLVYVFTLFLSDIMSMFFSLYITLYLPFFQEINPQEYYWIIIAITLLFFSENIYFIRYDFWSDTKKILRSLLISYILILIMMSFSKILNEYSKSFLFVFFIIMALFLPMLKRLTKNILFKFDFLKKRIKILGDSSLLDKIKIESEKNWYFGYKIVENEYEIVLIISNKLSVENLQNMIKRYSKYTKDIYVVPYMYNLDFSSSNIVNYFNIRLSAIHIENRLLNYKNIVIKYIFEKIIILLIFPFALILHILISILIKLDSSGEIIFKQKRFGKEGVVFQCYKYRTMYLNGDEILRNYLLKNPDEKIYYDKYHKYKNDPRITKIGRFLRLTSLDEFPQLINILIGNMNLIGPRPYMLNEKEKIAQQTGNIILRVKPGITGLWQVSGRNELTFQERVELEKWYIQNWSLWMDFVICMKTINVLISKVGAK